MLSFFRFIGDLKSISSGYERIIANRTPPASSPTRSPRVSTTHKTPTRTPTLLLVTTQCPLRKSLWIRSLYSPTTMSSGSSSGGSASAENSPQEEVILLQLATCYGMHEMARWLVLDVGKSPLFTNGVDSEKMMRFRRKPYGDTGDCTWSCALLNDLHAAAQAGGRAGGSFALSMVVCPDIRFLLCAKTRRRNTAGCMELGVLD